MRTFTTMTLFFVTITLTLSGCGRGGVAVSPATGEVRYNGQPVGGAMITFIPAADAAGTHFASALTEKDGTFTVLTAGAESNGAAVGEYIVTITKSVAVDAAGNEIIEPAVAPSSYDPTKIVTEEGRRPLMKNLLPAVYAERETTPLKAAVKKGKNHFKLELAD